MMIFGIIKTIILCMSVKISAGTICSDRLPSLTSPPAVDQSEGGNKIRPKVTVCRKDTTDKFYFCKCFDRQDKELTGENVENLAVNFCCKCPDNKVKEYEIFKIVTVGQSPFSMSNATEVYIGECDQVDIINLPKLEKLMMENVQEINVKNELKFLTEMSVSGRYQPSDVSTESGPNLRWDSKLSNPLSEIHLSNTRITKLPMEIQLQSLNITDSVIQIDNKAFKGSTINDLSIKNSVIPSIFRLGLAKYSSPLKFENNKVLSTCQAISDNEGCFLPKTPANGSNFSDNQVTCKCTGDTNCKDHEKAITKLECPRIIFSSFTCSDLPADPHPLPISYLKEKNVGPSCAEFEKDFDLLTTNIKEGGDPNFPIPSKPFPIWAIAVIIIVSLGFLIGSVVFIIRIQNKKIIRRKSLYKVVPADLASEGVENLDDDGE